MKNRLKTAFDLDAGQDYDVIGEPQDEGSARALWEQDPYQFQFWAVSLLEAQPQSEQRRGADRGVDDNQHQTGSVAHRRRWCCGQGQCLPRWRNDLRRRRGIAALPNPLRCCRGRS